MAKGPERVDGFTIEENNEVHVELEALVGASQGRLITSDGRTAQCPERLRNIVCQYIRPVTEEFCDYRVILSEPR